MRPSRAGLAGAAALAALVALALGGTVRAAYRQDMARARARLADQSELLSTPHGRVEFAQRGEGPPVLVVHGSGGGFDQGLLIGEIFLDEGFHQVAPSRFGYLRSTFQPGATFDDQAHAFAALLDHLGIDRAAVVAFSHGGPSALLLAALHPDRVSSLALVSCGVAASDAAGQEEASEKGSALVRIYEHDWLYWGLTHFFRRRFMGLMGATDEVISSLGPEERQLVDRVIDEMNPTTLRLSGVRFDNRAAMPNERIAAIRAPTLVVHAADDTLQLFHNAEVAAATIPGARLMRFDQGGHLVMAAQRQAIRQALVEHIRANQPR